MVRGWRNAEDVDIAIIRGAIGSIGQPDVSQHPQNRDALGFKDAVERNVAESKLPFYMGVYINR